MQRRTLTNNLFHVIKQNINPYFVVIALQAYLVFGCYGEQTTNNLKPTLENYSTNMSNNMSNINIAYYEEIKDLPNHPEKYLIEVRTPEELLETGKIPTSINIPLADVQQELSQNVSAEEFLQKYGRSKPAANDEVIFTCRSGRRAEAAAKIAISLGYTNVKNYKGSWLDWAEHEGLPK